MCSGENGGFVTEVFLLEYQFLHCDLSRDVAGVPDDTRTVGHCSPSFERTDLKLALSVQFTTDFCSSV